MFGHICERRTLQMVLRMKSQTFIRKHVYAGGKNFSLLGKLIFTKTVMLKLPTPELGVILRIFELFLLSILLICCPTYPTVDLNCLW